MAIEVEGSAGNTPVAPMIGTHAEIAAQMKAAASEAPTTTLPQATPAAAPSPEAAASPADAGITVETSGGPEAATPETAAESAAETPETPADTETPDQAEKRSTARSARQKRKIERMSAELDELRGVVQQFLGAGHGQGPAPTARPAAAQEPAPLLTEEQYYTQHADAEYGSYSQYAKDTLQQHKDYAVEAKAREWEAQEAARRAQQTFAEKQASWKAGVAATLKADPAFRAALDPEAMPDIPVALAAEIIQSSQGPALYRYLVMEPEVAERLAGMVTRQGEPTKELMRELGRLEALVEQTTKPVAPSRTTSHAPRPLDPVPGDVTAPRTFDAASLSNDTSGAEFAAFEKGLAAKRAAQGTSRYW